MVEAALTSESTWKVISLLSLISSISLLRCLRCGWDVTINGIKTTLGPFLGKNFFLKGLLYSYYKAVSAVHRLLYQGNSCFYTIPLNF